MSASKRARACDNCHSIKIKCELGTTGGGPGPCSRCVRLGKDCKITPPKRQKDRVVELEAQVEALTRLLKSQNIQPPSPTETTQLSEDKGSGENVANAGLGVLKSQKKRKLEEDGRGGNVSSSTPNFLDRLDAIISQDVQSELLDRYRSEIFPVIPLVPIAEPCSYASMRETRPILLQAAIYVACSGVITVDAQEEMTRLTWDALSWVAIEKKVNSLDVLQAIQITYLWCRTPKRSTHVAVFDLMDYSSKMAEELCLGGPISSPEIFGWARRDGMVDNEEAWRTWLVQRLISASICLLLRRPDTQKWTEHEEISLQMLEYWQEAAVGTRLVCHIVKAERLGERIAAASGFYDLDSAVDVADPAAQSSRISLQGAMLDFQAAMPSHLDSGLVTFWRLIATLYLHEPILHTPTNKRSFTAPFLAERQSITDFPAPLEVAEEHITSLHMLGSTLHALLDVFLSFDVATSLALPAVLVHSRVAYAHFILVKLYVATSAAGNTFGAYLDPESLRVDHYLLRAVKEYENLSKLDPRSGATRVLYSAVRMREWYINYKSTFVDHKLSNDQGAIGTSLPMLATQYDWTGAAEDCNVPGFGLEALFGDPLSIETMDFIPWDQHPPLDVL